MVDTSFYKELGEEQVNPLKSLADLQSLKNAQLQNQLLQTNNQRGQVGLSTDKVGLNKAQADLAMQQYNYLNKIMGDLSVKARSPQGISQDEMITAGVNAVAEGIIPHSQLNNFIMSLGEDTPQNNAATIANMQYKIQDAAKQHAITYGTGIKVDTGAKQGYGTVQDPQYGGSLDIASTLNNELTPQDKVASREVYNKQNQKVLKSVGELYTDTGERDLPQYGRPGEVSEAQIAAKDIPELDANGNELIAAPAIGSQKRIEDSQARIQAVREEATKAAPDAATIDKVYNLSKAGVETGNTKAFWSDVKNTLAATGVSSDKMKTEAETFGELQKYMAQISQGNGIRSDKELDQVLKANPNDKMLPGTIQNVTRYLLANVQGKILKQNALNNAIGNGLDPDKEEKFKNQWDKVYDPRAVELTLLSPKERDKFLDKQDDKTADKIIKSYKEMRQLGAFD